jgi:hypothetical protein
MRQSPAPPPPSRKQETRTKLQLSSQVPTICARIRNHRWANLACRPYKRIMCTQRAMLRVVLAVCSAVGWVAVPEARATPFVDQPITLPSSQWALNLGLGMGHEDQPAPLDDITGFGVNLELRGGLTPSVQFGVRTGLRLGSEGRLTQADRFGRAFETETYGVGVDSVANPEVSLRVALARTHAAALALEGRVYIPIEDGTELGIMVALPFHLHLGPSARFDSGVYIPVIFTDPRTTVISFPFHFWFQANPDLALGLLTGVRLYRPGGGTTVPLGVGINYAISRDTDLRTWLLFPNVKGSDSTKDFGLGLALEARF